MREVPKPDLQRFVDAVKQLTDLAADKLGGVPREQLQSVVVTAIEKGIELQREVILQQEQVTPMLPPPTEPPVSFEPPTTPRLPRGIR